MRSPFEYRKLGDFTYHILPDPITIKAYLREWILREWQADHNEAPHEQWTVEWINLLPHMEFELEIIELDSIHPRPDLMSVEEFQVSLRERADDREWSLLRGVSTEPRLVNRNGFELMDGYTRYMVLKRHNQKEVFAYVGSTGGQSVVLTGEAVSKGLQTLDAGSNANDRPPSGMPRKVVDSL